MLKKKKKHNPNWPQIPDHSYRILIFGGSGSGKTNSLFHLISQKPDIDKIFLYAKDLYEAKYQFLINKRESTGLKHLNDYKAFYTYHPCHSSTQTRMIWMICIKILNSKIQILIAFDDMMICLVIKT